jgi:hypothetical protein
MKNFFSFSYWLNLRPNPIEPTAQKFFLSFVIILLVLTVVFFVLKLKNRSFYNRIWRKLNTFFLTNFIVGLLFLFFAYEMIPFLSSRFWLLLWLMSDLVWLYFIIRLLMGVPKIRKAIAKEKEFKKYLP